MINKPRWYDPESLTTVDLESKLKALYVELYPWHGTSEARHYDYPAFSVALSDWANDDFYVQHFTAKTYLIRLGYEQGIGI